MRRFSCLSADDSDPFELAVECRREVALCLLVYHSSSLKFAYKEGGNVPGAYHKLVLLENALMEDAVDGDQRPLAVLQVVEPHAQVALA